MTINDTTSKPSTKPNNMTDITQHHTPERYQQLLDFIQQTFTDQDVTVEDLPGDASFRRYHRVLLTSPETGQDASYIVMNAPPALESVEQFVSIALLLAMKVNVPTIVGKDISNGFLVLQDFGNQEFAHLLSQASESIDTALNTESGKNETGETIVSINKSEVPNESEVPKDVDALYHWAIDSLVQLQSISTELAKHSFQVPEYDASLLEREIALFTDWFLPHIGVMLDEGTTERIMWDNFTQYLVESIQQQPQVLVHRDYHSRNLMRDQYHPETLGVIDFQDAVIGPYTYDLVSLLRDAYVSWDESQIQNWTAYFWQQIKPEATLAQFVAQMNMMGVQRHLKILGIFVRLAKRDGKLRYLEDIPKVWQDLMIEMSALAAQKESQSQTHIKPIYDWLKATVEPKVQEAFVIPAHDSDKNSGL